jgi:hypothetical protein
MGKVTQAKVVMSKTHGREPPVDIAAEHRKRK